MYGVNGAGRSRYNVLKSQAVSEIFYDKTLPRPYLNSCLDDPAGHFNGLLETDSSDRRNPRSEP